MHIDVSHSYILRSDDVKQEPSVEDLPANPIQSHPVYPSEHDYEPADTNDEAVDPIEFSANRSRTNPPEVTIISI